MKENCKLRPKYDFIPNLSYLKYQQNCRTVWLVAGVKNIFLNRIKLILHTLKYLKIGSSVTAKQNVNCSTSCQKNFATSFVLS